MSTALLPSAEIEYPDSDGLPIADNTKQFYWITTIEGWLECIFMDRPDVFVAGDLLWYPIRGDNQTRTAPDGMVAIGRTMGDRGSYKQWEEGGVAPQVVFEVLSPLVTSEYLDEKFEFYRKFGVQEYYIFDPDEGILRGFLRNGANLVPMENTQGWVSPLLNVRMEVVDGKLEFRDSKGERFLDFVETREAVNKLKREIAEIDQLTAEINREAAHNDRQIAELRARLQSLKDRV